MDPNDDEFGLELHSLVTRDGVLKLSLARTMVPEPKADEIVVRVEAAPINPSDIGLLLGAADMSSATTTGTGAATMTTATVPERLMRSMTKRLGESMLVGNEAAGLVVKAGSSDEARAAIGKTVAMIGGAMYAQYRCIKLNDCLVLPSGVTAAEGASSLVNPLTALGMVETMRAEGHTALVHTAAASSLGQILNRVCLKDGIDLVNIVRSEDQEALLRGAGARYVCNSKSPTFFGDLTEALATTGATLAFDAIGGGKLAGQILNAMEVAITRTTNTYNRYGSSVHKQVYIYGGLDLGPTEFNRGFGMSWGMGGWLLFPFLQKSGPAKVLALREKIAGELKTTFATRYTQEISLADALCPDIIDKYRQQSTGEKYLINPSKDALPDSTALESI